MTKTESKIAASRTARAVIIGISLGAILLSCSNMLSGDDVKDKVSPDVVESNADSVTITIVANPSSGGSLSQSGSAKVKMGVNFSLTATAYDAYYFTGWSATPSGSVEFSDKSKSTTMVRVTSKGKITVKANFLARPKVIDFAPNDHAEGVLKNLPIYIQFSQAMDTTKLSTGDLVNMRKYISVQGKDNGNPSDPLKDIHESFVWSWNSPANTTLTLTPSPDLPDTYRVVIIVKQNTPDKNGVTFANDFTYYYTTGILSDPSVPAYSTLPTIRKGWSSPVNAKQLPSTSTYATNTYDIIIHSVASSTSGGSVILSSMGVKETDLSTGAFTEKWDTYSNDYKYELSKTSGEGEKRLTITLRNSNGKTLVTDVMVLLDKVSPIVTSIALSSGKPSNYVKDGEHVYLNVSATDSAAGGEAGSGFTATTDEASITINESGASLSGASGSYTGTYDVDSGSPQGLPSYSAVIYDLAGNSTTVGSGSPTAVYVDTLAPTVTMGKLYSNYASNRKYAKQSDSIVMIFSVNETNVDTVSATINGEDVGAANVSGPQTLNYAVGADNVLSVAYGVTVTDKAGNSTGPVTTGAKDYPGTGTGTVAIDNSFPVLNLTTIASDNGSGTNPLYAKTGDTITLNFTLDEPNLQSLTAKIAGQDATVNHLGGTSYSATYSVAGTESQGSAATYSVTALDQVGNTTIRSNAVGPATGSVTIDYTAPHLNFASMSSDNNHYAADPYKYAKRGDKLTMSFTASDDQTSVASESATIATHASSAPSFVGGTTYSTDYTLDTNVAVTYAQGNAAYTVTVYDRAGNPASISSTTASAIIDTAAPTVSADKLYSSYAATGHKYAKENATISLEFTVNDANLESVAATINGTGAAGVTNVTGSQTGTYTVGTENVASVGYGVTAIDRAGNSTGPVSTGAKDYPGTGTGTVAIDNTFPVVTANKLYSSYTTTGRKYAKTSDTISLEFSVTEDNVSTVAATINSTGATGVTSVAGSQTGTYTVGSGNVASVSYGVTVVDLAGNSTGPVTTGAKDFPGTGTGTVTIDNTVPTVGFALMSSDNTYYAADPNKYAKRGDKLTMSFTADDGETSIASESATIATHASSAPSFVSGTTYSTDYTLDTNVAVTYTQGNAAYTVTVYDQAGNYTTIGSTTANVIIDTAAPTVSADKLYSSYTTTGHKYAKEDDTITLVFTVTETNLSSVAATINGTGATGVTNSTGSQTVTYTVGTENVASVGYGVTAIDRAGNSTGPVSTGAKDYPGTGTGTVAIDNTFPVVTANKLYSSYTTTGRKYAKSSDTISLEFSVTEDNVSTVAATINGAGATGVTNVAGNQTGTYTVGSGNVASVSYGVTVVDLAGNSTGPVTAGAKDFPGTGTGTVTIDNAVPTVSFALMSSDNTYYAADPNKYAKRGDKLTMSFTADDGETSIASESATIATHASSAPSFVSGTTYSTNYTLDTNVAVTYAQGNAAYTVTVYDQAGNYTTIGSTTANAIIDTAAPTVTADKLYSSYTTTGRKYAKENATITLVFTVTETNLSSVAATINGTGATGVTNVTGSQTVTYTVGTENVASVGYGVTATDRAGNSTGPVSTGAKDYPGAGTGTVAIDNTLPVVTADKFYSDNGINRKYAKEDDTISLEFSVTEANVSTVAATINGAGATGVTSVAGSQTGTYTVGTGNVTSVTYGVTVTDLAGNSNVSVTTGAKDYPGTGTGTVRIDNAVPHVSFASMSSDNTYYAADPNKYATRGNKLTMSFTADDDEGALSSESATIATHTSSAPGFVSGTTYSTDYTLDTNVAVTYTQGNAAYTVTVYDQAGNYTTIGSTTSDAIIDTAAPTVTADKFYSSYTTTGRKYAKENATISLVFTVTETNLSSVAATINGTGATGVTNSTGSQTVTYTVGTENVASVGYGVTATDRAGNSTGPVSTGAKDYPGAGTGTVAIDNTLPVVTADKFYSDNGINRKYAKEDDTISLEFSVTEANVSTVAATINGAGATGVTSVAGSQTGTYTVGTGNVTSVTYGVTVTDLAGNSNVSVTTGAKDYPGTGTGTVRIDNAVPHVSFASMSSDNTYYAADPNKYATRGNKLTMSFTADDDEGALSSESATIATHTSSAPGFVSGTTYSTDYTLDTNVAVTYTQGNAAYTVTVYDQAGNYTTIGSTTSDAIIDTAAPTVTWGAFVCPSNTAYTAYAKSGVAIKLYFDATDTLGTVTFTDAGSHTLTPTVDATTAADTGYYPTYPYVASYTTLGTETEGAVGYSVAASDFAGNTTTRTTGITTPVHLDYTPPTLISSGTPAAGEVKVAFSTNSSPKYLKLTIAYHTGDADTGGYVYYRAHPATYDESASTGNSTFSGTSYTFGALAATDLDFYIKDEAGNKSTNFAYANYGSSSYSTTVTLTDYNGTTITWSNRVGSPISRILNSLKLKSSSGSSGPARVAFADAIYGDVDPAQKAKTNLAMDEALRNDAGMMPIEVRYAVPVTSRAQSVDSSGLSLLGRSAAAAAKAAGRAAETAVEARATVPAPGSVAVPASPAAPGSPAAPASPAGSSSAPLGSTAPGAQGQTGVSTPSSVPLPGERGPQEPSRAPVPAVDLYVSQKGTRPEETDDSAEEAESGDTRDR